MIIDRHFRNRWTVWVLGLVALLLAGAGPARAQVSAAPLAQVSPADGAFLPPGAVFRWNPIEDPNLTRYRLVVAADPSLELIRFTADIRDSDQDGFIEPYIPVKFGQTDLFDLTAYFWGVVAVDLFGNEIARSPTSRTFLYELNGTGFTLLAGLVLSNLDQAAIAGATLRIASEHKLVNVGGEDGLSEEAVAQSVETGEYLMLVPRSDETGEPIDLPLEVDVLGEGFEPARVEIEAEALSEDNIERIVEVAPVIPEVVSVQKAYIAYYGRPGDPGGVEYWAERLALAGGDLDALIDAYANSAEADARFGGLSNEELLDNLYQQMFGRDPDPEGRAFYLGLLDTGAMSLQTVMLDVLNGARNEDAVIIANKVAASLYFTQQVEARGRSYQFADIEPARDMLALIAVDQSTLDPALTRADEIVEAMALAP